MTPRAAAAAEAPPGAGAPSVVSQLLAGLTVSLAMVPEALAFTFVAGVSPLVGLQTAATMAAVAALAGAQPAVISGAAGATAVVFAPLVASHGVEYLFAAVLLTGALQVLAGVARLGKFIRLVPQPVMLGFVNGLGLVIGLAQLQQFKVGGAWMTGTPLYVMTGLTALTMAIIAVWPRLTKAVPAPLASIAIVTAAVKGFGIPTRTIGDLASVAGGLPAPHLPAVPATLETLALIAPYAVSVAAVGLIETLLTQQLVDEITGRHTETHTEVIGQGVANLASGALGGMGGCAMIGQSMINVGSGGRTRVSGLTCAAAISGFVLAGSAVIESVPLAALVGVMFMLVGDIFDWTSFGRLSKIPRTDAAVLVMVTVVTYFTNLAVAVFAGVVLSSLGFAWKSATRGVVATRRADDDTRYGTAGATVYALAGPLFFGSVQSFKELFRGPGDPVTDEVVLDFADSRVWDSSALEAVNEVAGAFAAEGKRVHLRHLSPDCRRLLSKAGDLVSDVDVEASPDDPTYGVFSDYPPEVVDRDVEGFAKLVPTVR